METTEKNKENILSIHLHHFTKKNKPLSPFVSKLRFLLNNDKYDNAIHWSIDGRSIIVTDIEAFRQTILEKGDEMFKTSNFTSFVRQLNLYGFRKIPSNGRGDPTTNMRFEHVYFRRERPDLMHLVSRTCLAAKRQRFAGSPTNQSLASSEKTLLSDGERFLAQLSSPKNNDDETPEKVRKGSKAQVRLTFPILKKTQPKQHRVRKRRQLASIFENTLVEDVIENNVTIEHHSDDFSDFINDTFLDSPTHDEHNYALPFLADRIDEQSTYEFLDKIFTDEKVAVQSLLDLMRQKDDAAPWKALCTLAEVSSRLCHSPEFRDEDMKSSDEDSESSIDFCIFPTKNV